VHEAVDALDMQRPAEECPRGRGRLGKACGGFCVLFEWNEVARVCAETHAQVREQIT